MPITHCGSCEKWCSVSVAKDGNPEAKKSPEVFAGYWRYCASCEHYLCDQCLDESKPNCSSCSKPVLPKNKILPGMFQSLFGLPLVDEFKHVVAHATSNDEESHDLFAGLQLRLGKDWLAKKSENSFEATNSALGTRLVLSNKPSSIGAINADRLLQLAAQHLTRSDASLKLAGVASETIGQGWQGWAQLLQRAATSDHTYTRVLLTSLVVTDSTQTQANVTALLEASDCAWSKHEALLRLLMTTQLSTLTIDVELEELAVAPDEPPKKSHHNVQPSTTLFPKPSHMPSLKRFEYPKADIEMLVPGHWEEEDGSAVGDEGSAVVFSAWAPSRVSLDTPFQSLIDSKERPTGLKPVTPERAIYMPTGKAVIVELEGYREEFKSHMRMLAVSLTQYRLAFPEGYRARHGSFKEMEGVPMYGLVICLYHVRKDTFEQNPALWRWLAYTQVKRQMGVMVEMPSTEYAKLCAATGRTVPAVGSLALEEMPRKAAEPQSTDVARTTAPAAPVAPSPLRSRPLPEDVEPDADHLESQFHIKALKYFALAFGITLAFLFIRSWQTWIAASFMAVTAGAAALFMREADELPGIRNQRIAMLVTMLIPGVNVLVALSWVGYMMVGRKRHDIELGIPTAIFFAAIGFALAAAGGLVQNRLATNGCIREFGARPDIGSLIKTDQCIVDGVNAMSDYRKSLTHRVAKGLPNTPSAFAGKWIATQGSCSYEHMLTPKGGFESFPLECPVTNTAFVGSWGVVDDVMVWVNKERPLWPPDVNKIESRSKDQFVLIERNGARTTFKRQEERKRVSPSAVGDSNPNYIPPERRNNVEPQKSLNDIERESHSPPDGKPIQGNPPGYRQ